MKPRMMIALALFALLSCSKEAATSEQMPQPPQPPQPPQTAQSTMKITVNDTTFATTLADNAAASAFKALLPLTLNMSDFSNNEKVASLPRSLPTSAYNPRTIHAGDIMLYGSSSVVVFYETFSTPYSYTRLGVVDNVAGLRSALGGGDVAVKFELE